MYGKSGRGKEEDDNEPRDGENKLEGGEIMDEVDLMGKKWRKSNRWEAREKNNNHGTTQ